MSDIDVLRATPLFAGLADHQLQRVASVVCNKTRVPAGSLVVREGDHGESVFILAKGDVEVSRSLGLDDGRESRTRKGKTLLALSAPQFFGEMGLLEDADRSATIVARSDCELFEITRADFTQLAEADTELGYKVVHNIAIAIAHRMRRTDREIVKLTAALSLALGNR